MKSAKFLAAAAALVIAPFAAQAQDVGATVMGNDGNAIGTVLSNDGTLVTVDTGKHQVPLGVEMFGSDENGPTLNIAKAQLDQMMDDQIAAATATRDAALVVGAEVVTADQQSLGAIDEIDGDNIVIMSADESKFTLPRELLAVDANGSLMALANHADIMAALEAAGG
ncbi:hypothetical protein [Alteraurantiacibacter aquimixticola]|uniref:PRC-barrel domain-containing protein n=1 Tax=Alteraurantiacibacter aquimixticola TaxID=2489173 RepID=A0A4T3F3W7_9SPHN|nr:hypothetical protein [Alteraurantiacibacter aquimixticola]TIX51808.1 hypothetical protein E5222_05020 [Alteraurantiacibacter aquimixticola]